MTMEQEALQFAEKLRQFYFEQRDSNALLRCMDPCVTWIGTGTEEMCVNVEQAQQLLEWEFAEYSGTFSVADSQLSVLQTSDTSCVIYGQLRAVPDGDEVEEQEIRLTLVCRRGAQGMRLVHCHFSRPDIVLERGHCYAPKAARGNNAMLRDVLQIREREIESLTRNIPGGVCRCKNDANFTLLEISDGFLEMVGYTRAEITRLFGNGLLNMIYPSDRNEVQRRASGQKWEGDTIELEYRLLCKNGRTLWILERCRLMTGSQGTTTLCCILLDITSRYRAQEELRLSLERHEVIMDQATNIIVEWDIVRDKLVFSSNWKKRFGYEPDITNAHTDLVNSTNVLAEDIPAFKALIQEIEAGEPYSECELRIRNASGKLLWCRVRATTQFDAEGYPIKAVGVILDIDAEKKQKQALLEQAQRDALTGLYNKAAVNSLVAERMQDNRQVGWQALMVLDVDFFKEVNDTYGHLCGDSLLAGVANVLKSCIRSSDVAGRIGGDEFLIYLPNVANSDAAAKKAKAILNAMQTLAPEFGAMPITCSIGVAAAEYGQIDFLTLFQHADRALYYRKKNGRGDVAVYDPATCDDSIEDEPVAPAEEEYTAQGAYPDEDAPPHTDSLAQYVQRMLYEADDLAAALEQALMLAGRSYDVSRAYIVETGRERASFIWTGRRAEKTELQTPELLHYAGCNCGGRDRRVGTLYCLDAARMRPELRDRLLARGVHSSFQYAIVEDNQLWGVVGFDECRMGRQWSREQIKALQMTASALATSVIRLRMRERLRQLSNDRLGQLP